MNEKHYLEILAHRWEGYLNARGMHWLGFAESPAPEGAEELPEFVWHMYWALPEILRPNLQYAIATKGKLESMVLAWDKLQTYWIKCEPEFYVRYGDCE